MPELTDAQQDALRRDLLDETLLECERLLTDAEAAAGAIRLSAHQEAAEHLADAKRRASEDLSAAEVAAQVQLNDAERQANTLIQAAMRAAEKAAESAEPRALTESDDAIASRVSEAERTAAARLAEADANATRQLLEALDEARLIVTNAQSEANEIIVRAQSLAQPAENTAPAGGLPPDPDGAAPPSGGRRRGLLHKLGFVLALLLAIGLARAYVVAPYAVAAVSMEPALSDGDHILLNKLAFAMSDPKRGDVVVFDTATMAATVGMPNRTLVKRVIGLPGDVVQSIENNLEIDGEVIDDPWRGSTVTPAFGPIEVPAGMVLVLGDNRVGSVDSRTFGPVPIDALAGQVEVVIWPPKRAGRV